MHQSLPIMKGPSIPPMLAMLLIKATPMAAAGPLRKVAGSAEMMPAGPHSTVAHSMARNAVAGLVSMSADMVPRARVAITKGTNAWYFRSPAATLCWHAGRGAHDHAFPEGEGSENTPRARGRGRESAPLPCLLGYAERMRPFVSSSAWSRHLQKRLWKGMNTWQGGGAPL